MVQFEERLGRFESKRFLPVDKASARPIARMTLITHGTPQQHRRRTSALSNATASLAARE